LTFGDFGQEDEETKKETPRKKHIAAMAISVHQRCRIEIKFCLREYLGEIGLHLKFEVS